MSIAQLNVGAYGSPDGPDIDRLPPQDVYAEQSVLGGMLLSKDAIADAAERLKAADFYRPAHELIFGAMIDLFARGEPVDAITVADEMTKRGSLSRVGGPAYLHDLVQQVPTAANVGYYAQIVAERAVLRQLVEAGTRIVQLGYGQGEGDVDEIVNRAQAEIYGVGEKRGTEDYIPLALTLEETLTEIEVASGRSDEFTGVPTGFSELDDLLHGLHKGQMIVVAARPAVGKALALDTPLPTPTGWTTMGEVGVGDWLLDASGRPTRVTQATAVMSGRPCFEVHFCDGEVIVADAEHQWLTHTRATRRGGRPGNTAPGVRTTAQIAATLRTTTAESRLNHSVAVAAPLQLPAADLPLSPYAVGAWLGGGSCAEPTITTADPEIVAFLEGEGLVLTPTPGSMEYRMRLPVRTIEAGRCVVCGRERCQQCRNDQGTVTGLLRGIGVLPDKHIPLAYLRGDEHQRRALLAGLLDTDGTVTTSGCVQFTTTSVRLAADVQELLASLGMRCGVSTKRVSGRSTAASTAFTLAFATDDEVFWLPRKQLRHKELRGRTAAARDSRFITEVRAIASVPLRCIEVDNADHLFLAGRRMVPTHNSTFGMDIARCAAIKHKMPTAIFSLEMSRTEISMRVIAAEGSIPLQELRKGTLGDAGWTKIAKVVGRISDSPLFIDDSPNMSLMEIRAKCRRIKQQHNLQLVVIDYLQLMSSGKKVESRQQEVSEFSRALKLLAKELEVPVIAISQLNRGPEQRTDKRPQMSDLRESGCLTADTRILRADTGAEVTLGELHASGERDIVVWALDERLRAVRRAMTHVFSTGVAPVFRLTLASGKTVRATENHPFLTYAGWQPLAALRTGSRVAVPRHVLAPLRQEPVVAEDLAGWAAAHGGRLPEAVFALPKADIARVVRDVFSSRLRITVDPDSCAGTIGMPAVPADLADQLSRLLIRFGVQTRVRALAAAVGGCRSDGVVELSIDGVDSQRRFLQEVGVTQPHAVAAEQLLALVRASAGRAGEVAGEVWDGLRAAALPQSTSPGDGSRGDGPLAEVARILDDAALELTATNDVFWDEVVTIDPDGVEEVFDATVPGAHNFVANGITVHNSIEQDADVVILLHKDREREGEADVLVVKHRNGPTKDIVLGFQGHYARFANMAANF